MKILCVIPSRIGSTRLKRKALLPIQGKPMVQWTYENAKRCGLLSEVIVATDSEEIAGVIQSVGGQVAMTDPLLATGTERVAAVAAQAPHFDIVINLQGDEPFIKPAMLEQLVTPFFKTNPPLMSTLASPLEDHEQLNPGIVKVITDLRQDAIYFSRSPLPYYRTQTWAPVYHHMGLYAFTYDFLMTYQKLPATPLEKAESLEQLRVLEHGYKIRVSLSADKTCEINTEAEYLAAQHFRYID